MRATRIKGLYEVGSVEPFPLTPVRTCIQQIGFKYPFSELFAHCHAPFSELVRQTFPEAWHAKLFDEASWINPQMQPQPSFWHQDGTHSMLLAILTTDESAGTEFSSCSKTVSLSQWHGMYGSSWDYDTVVNIYLQAEYITKPWTLYLITRNLYHRIRERKQGVFRVMLREHNFNYKLDYPDLGVLW